MKNKGFTLIELLVVIAIIGLLSTVIMTSLNQARSKGRDGRRLQDIRAIQQALEMYYDDKGYYPYSGWADADSTSSTYRNRWNTLANNLKPYLKVLPQDPFNRSTSSVTGDYSYSYYSAGYRSSGQTNQQWYMIVFRLENSNKNIEDVDGVTACNGRYFHYGSGSNGIVTVGGNCI